MLVFYDMVILCNAMRTFVGHLITKPYFKNSSCNILLVAGGIRGFQGHQSEIKLSSLTGVRTR